MSIGVFCCVWTCVCISVCGVGDCVGVFIYVWVVCAH